MHPCCTPKAILFDIDGTLVDSTPVVERSWRTWAQEYDVDAEEVMRVCHGRRTEDTVAEFVTPQQLAVAVARVQALELADFDGVTALPGARQLIDALSRQRWAAVTSGERALMTARLAAAQLPIPETMICAEDVAVGKPSPEGYLQAAAALGFHAEPLRGSRGRARGYRRGAGRRRARRGGHDHPHRRPSGERRCDRRRSVLPTCGIH